jgi:hypothetical protein
LIRVEQLRAFDALPAETYANVKLGAFYTIRVRLVLGRAVDALVRCARIVIKWNVPGIQKIDIAPEDIAVASLAVPRVIG